MILQQPAGKLPSENQPPTETTLGRLENQSKYWLQAITPPGEPRISFASAIRGCRTRDELAQAVTQAVFTELHVCQIMLHWFQRGKPQHTCHSFPIRSLGFPSDTRYGHKLHRQAGAQQRLQARNPSSQSRSKCSSGMAARLPNLFLFTGVRKCIPAELILAKLAKNPSSCMRNDQPRSSHPNCLLEGDMCRHSASTTELSLHRNGWTVLSIAASRPPQVNKLQQLVFSAASRLCARAMRLAHWHGQRLQRCPVALTILASNGKLEGTRASAVSIARAQVCAMCNVHGVAAVEVSAK